ncbi:MAG: hypothetical protein ACOZAN_03405 [Patescibacteria group bacterium]
MINQEAIIGLRDLRVEVDPGQHPNTVTARTRLEMALERIRRSNDRLLETKHLLEPDKAIARLHWLAEQLRYQTLMAGIDSTGALDATLIGEMLVSATNETKFEFDQDGMIRIDPSHRNICLVVIKQPHLAGVNFFLWS